MKQARKLTALAAFGMAALVAGIVSYCHSGTDVPSTCFGTVGSGALRNGWRLPQSGPNFSTYSLAGWGLGRTYVHSSVHAVVLDAYRKLHQELPDRQFIYGETGLVRGGSFAPHRTHQNGLSVDFMVPVRAEDGTPAVLPSSALNEFGYGIVFDSRGRYERLTIDFEALAVHLAQLSVAAKSHRVAIARVIFAPDLQAHLRRTNAWVRIRSLPFSRTKAWIRHDDHYHVDFAVECAPLNPAH